MHAGADLGGNYRCGKPF